jgi:hypothetical protein
MVKGKLATNGGMLRLQANDQTSGAATGSGAVKLMAGIETGMGAIELSGAEIVVGAGVMLAGQDMRWKADSMRIGNGAQLQAAHSVSLNPSGAGTAIVLGQASDGTPGVLPQNPGMQFTPPPVFNTSVQGGKTTADSRAQRAVDCEVR